VKELLTKGAFLVLMCASLGVLRAEEKKSDLFEQNRFLHCCAERGNRAGMRLALDRGADVNDDWYGVTALAQAASRNHFACVDWLLCNGADIEKGGFAQAPPLEIAAHFFALESLVILFKHKVQVPHDIASRLYWWKSEFLTPKERLVQWMLCAEFMLTQSKINEKSYDVLIQAARSIASQYPPVTPPINAYFADIIRRLVQTQKAAV
jgi:hypothetical protein